MILPSLGLVWMLAGCTGQCWFLDLQDCLDKAEEVRVQLNLDEAPLCYFEEVRAEVG